MHGSNAMSVVTSRILEGELSNTTRCLLRDKLDALYDAIYNLKAKKVYHTKMRENKTDDLFIDCEKRNVVSRFEERVR